MQSSDDSYLSADSDNSYFSADDNLPNLGNLLNGVFSLHPINFNVCHINAQSIPSHFDEMRDTFSSDFIHALLVSESWLKPTLPSTSFSIPNSVLIRNDRTNKGGGGIAIYLKSHIKYKCVLQSPSAYCSSMEYLFIEVDVGQKLLLGVIYCPPSIDYFACLETVLDNLLLDYSRVLIMGDFNTCILKQNSRSSKLLSLIDSSNLNILDLKPTHFTHSCDSMLDLIITSDIDLIASHGQFEAPGFSHHDLIYASLNVKIPKRMPATLIQRNFAHMNTDELHKDASSIGWLDIVNFDNVNDQIDFLTRNIISLYDRHAPTHLVKLKHKPSPWMSDVIRRSMAKRNKAFRNYKRNRSDENWLLYKKIRNICNRLCRDAKRRYISDQIERATPGGIWSFLRSIGIGKSKSSDVKMPFDLNTFNNHFSSCVGFDSIIKQTTLSELSNRSPRQGTPFEFLPVSQDSVRKAFLALKSKATGYDDIARVMVLYILDYVLPALTYIINCSFSTGQFPDAWKSALILPLPKVSNPLLLNQFRPISILPFLSKIIESLVHSQVNDYLNRSSLFNSLQSGFKAGHSTTTALLKVTEDIRMGFENSKITILVLIDFSNAFNAVDHDLLLAVLQGLHFCDLSLKWFSSYLKGRRQAVKSSHNRSDWCELRAGVPQGGILSPLLFSLFIDKLASYLDCSYHFYADDLQLYHTTTVNDIGEAIALLNKNLTQLFLWSTRFGIQVNPNKCQAIIIGSSRQLSKINPSGLTSLIFNNSTIPFSTTVKDLGLILDCNLSWTAQVSEISRKFYASLHSIIKFKHFLPISTKISLVNCLLLPIIDYADVSYLDLSEELLNKLDRLLNTCIRFIFGLRKYDHVSEYRSQLKWLNIRLRRNARVLHLLFSILYDVKTPVYLKESFQFLSDTHDRDLRSTDTLLLSTPKHSTAALRKSFCVTAVTLWNQLPLQIRKAQTKQIFKLLLKKHYLSLTTT